MRDSPESRLKPEIDHVDRVVVKKGPGFICCSEPCSTALKLERHDAGHAVQVVIPGSIGYSVEHARLGLRAIYYLHGAACRRCARQQHALTRIAVASEIDARSRSEPLNQRAGGKPGAQTSLKRNLLRAKPHHRNHRNFRRSICADLQ